MTDRTEAWIIDGVRSPRGRGKAKGKLHHIHPQDLLAQCLNALVERTGVTPDKVDDVVVGNGNSSGDHGHCIGRLAVLAAGWPYETPGFTLNRFCGSGQTAVTLAAMGVLSGMQDAVVAGGVESMSRWPLETGAPATLDGHNPRLRSLYQTVPQGISADLIASVEGFTREECDNLAAESQRRAAAALEEKRFERSLIPIRHPDGSVALDTEEHPRRGTSLATLAELKPAFEAMGAHRFEGYSETFDEMCVRAYPELDHVEHVHHAGNSSGVVDGASALLVVSSGFARANGLVPRARVVASAVAGSEPVIMLTGPAPASRRALKRAGMTTGDIDLWEINEAFAAVVLKAVRDLNLDMGRVNVNGGAIALGHPIGATGAILVQTALDELERTDSNTALVTMCTGGGMGTATVIERL